MSLFSKVKQFLLGKPIHSKRAHGQRLIIFLALPVFASDALSSTAYASEEILLKLRNGGPAAHGLLFSISIALVALLWIVIASYRKTIVAYPEGGGAYSVASENIGQYAGLTAAGALLIGYLLTVTVSIAAGVSALVSIYPQLHEYSVLISAIAISFITFINLRGVKESGMVFSIPTYSFVVLIGLIVIVAFKIAFVDQVAHIAPSGIPNPAVPLSAMSTFQYVLFVFGAFAAGCTALTGTEAIANGVTAFKAPEAANASKTLVVMGVILSVLVLGVSFAAQHFGIVPMSFTEPGYRTVLAQVAAIAFGDESAMFVLTQFATALILVLAANTAYSDFPRLGRLVARDGFLPRQLASVGDRLVYQNGIVTLAVLSIALIALTGADTHKMLPMYAISVFMTFTFSQAGMVVWWQRHHPRAWDKWVNVVGAIVCGLVAIVLLVTRFVDGAYLTLIFLALLMSVFVMIRRHYDWLAGRLNITPADTVIASTTTVLLMIPRLHKGVLKAISYSKALSDDVRAIHVTLDPATLRKVKEDWIRFGEDIPLVVLESPFRSLIQPIMDYVDQAIAESGDPNHMVTVIVPQAVPRRWWQGVLHNNAAVALKMALGTRKNVVVTNVRYFF